MIRKRKVRPRKTAKKRRVAKKRAVTKKTRAGISRGKALMLEKVGEVTHYFPKVKAAAVKILKGVLSIGEEIYIKGHTTDFKEKVNSMQLDHVAISQGKKGQEIGLLVKSRVRIGDSVYRV